MRRFMWLFSFVFGAPAALFAALLTLSVISPRAPASSRVLGIETTVFESGAAVIPSQSVSISTADARPLIIQNYLNKYSSPLEPFSRDLVHISDQYGLDYRLLIAIAQQESNLCKRIPPNSHNCWGHGIYGDKITRYDSYVLGATAVAKTLKKYRDSYGLDTPEKIMTKYTPPSLEKGGAWAKGINQFLAELE